MNSKTKAISALALSVTILAGLGTASANGDAKVYPGEMGVKWSGPAPSYNSGAIGNPSATSWMYVDLPVVNDDTGSGIDNSYATVLDRHFSSNVRCSINTVYWNNSTDSFFGFWGANRYSSGSDTNTQVLTTGSATHGSGRHEYFSCAIPPTYAGYVSYIISYYVTE